MARAVLMGCLLFVSLPSCSKSTPDVGRTAATEPPPVVQSAPAASSSPPPAPASSTSGSKPKPYEEPPIENGGTAPCYKYGKPYGEGAPTADEMLAVVRKFPA